MDNKIKALSSDENEERNQDPGRMNPVMAFIPMGKGISFHGVSVCFTVCKI